MTRKYWKGLEELKETPEFLRSKDQEFPTELSVEEFLGDENLKETSTARRDFLKFLGFSVAAATVAALEKQGGIDVGKVRTTALAGVSAAQPLGESFTNMAQGLGAVTIFSKTITGLNTPMEKLASNIPILGDVIGKAIKKINNAVSVNLPTAATATPTEKDAIIMNDGIVKFHPADKFMQVNDSTMIAGTNVDGNKKLARAITGGGQGIDYNRLAAAIASAMQHVKVEATVKPDMLFSATKMNDRRRF